MSYWVHKKQRFRHRGGKEGAIQAMKRVQENGMEKLEQKKGIGSVKVRFLFYLLAHYVPLRRQNGTGYKTDGQVQHFPS